MRYGLSTEDWLTAKAEIRGLCISVARSGQTISYTELAAQITRISVHPGAYVFHALLREMCRNEEAAGRGLLCAVVVSRKTKRPGAGFYRLMQQQGRDCQDPEACWQQEVMQLYRTWQDIESDIPS